TDRHVARPGSFQHLELERLRRPREVGVEFLHFRAQTLPADGRRHYVAVPWLRHVAVGQHESGRGEEARADELHFTDRAAAVNAQVDAAAGADQRVRFGRLLEARLAARARVGPRVDAVNQADPAPVIFDDVRRERERASHARGLVVVFPNLVVGLRQPGLHLTDLGLQLFDGFDVATAFEKA